VRDCDCDSWRHNTNTIKTTNGGMRYNRVLVRYLLAQWMADSSFKQEETESHVLLLIQ